MCYEQIISLDEMDLFVFESLECIYEMYGCWEDFIDILCQKVNLIYDLEMIIDICHRIVIVYEEQFNDLGCVIGVYFDLFVNEQGYMSLFEVFERFYSVSVQWDDVFEVLN